MLSLLPNFSWRCFIGLSDFVFLGRGENSHGESELARKIVPRWDEGILTFLDSWWSRRRFCITMH